MVERGALLVPGFLLLLAACGALEVGSGQPSGAVESASPGGATASASLGVATASTSPPPAGCTPEWSTFEPPSVTGDYRTLGDTAALADDDVFAVGSGLLLHWDGSEWNVGDLSADGTYGDVLGVAAISASDAWSVGYAASDPDHAQEQTIALHWDGSSWSEAATPDPSSRKSQRLTDVAAVSSNDVWAVGYRLEGQLAALNQTLIVHWNGSAWEQVDSPNVDGVNNELQAVRAVSARDVWAIGSVVQDRSVIEPKSRTLTLHWDGTNWGIVDSPNTGERENELHRIAATSSSDVWAVGSSHQQTASFGQTLALHWDGRTWGVVPSPNVGRNSNQLLGVAASGASDVWAVGFAYEDQGVELHPLALHWNGAAWETASVPQLSELPHSERLAAAAAIGPADVWAVGWAGFLDGTSAIRIDRLACA